MAKSPPQSSRLTLVCGAKKGPKTAESVVGRLFQRNKAAEDRKEGEGEMEAGGVVVIGLLELLAGSLSSSRL